MVSGSKVTNVLSPCIGSQWGVSGGRKVGGGFGYQPERSVASGHSLWQDKGKIITSFIRASMAAFRILSEAEQIPQRIFSTLPGSDFK